MAGVSTITVDRSKQTQVKKHINEVFTHLQKAKTKVLLSSYYQWYKSNSEYNSEKLHEFNNTSMKKDEVLAKTKKSAEAVFGDKHAIMLTKFVLENSVFEDQLIKIAIELTELSKLEGEDNLSFTNLFTTIEVEMIKDIFKLLRSKKGKVDVLETPGEERKRIQKQKKIIEIEEIKKSFIKNELKVVKTKNLGFIYDKLPLEREKSISNHYNPQSDISAHENPLKEEIFKRVSHKKESELNNDSKTKNVRSPTVSIPADSIRTLAECMNALNMTVSDITKHAK